MMTPQQQYTSEWHNSFVNFIGGFLGFVESLIVLPEAADEDKCAPNFYMSFLRESTQTPSGKRMHDDSPFLRPL